MRTMGGDWTWHAGGQIATAEDWTSEAGPSNLNEAAKKREIDNWRRTVAKEIETPYPYPATCNSNQNIHPDMPGYCYLILFKKQYWNDFEWPAYPQIQEIFQYDPRLRAPRANIRARKTYGRNDCLHIERISQGQNGWDQMDNWILSGYGWYHIGAFRWTVQMAMGLRDFLVGYQHVMPMPIPTPIEPTGANQDAVARREQEIADVKELRYVHTCASCCCLSSTTTVLSHSVTSSAHPCAHSTSKIHLIWMVVVLVNGKT